jgi:hypothetical protein
MACYLVKHKGNFTFYPYPQKMENVTTYITDKESAPKVLLVIKIIKMNLWVVKMLLKVKVKVKKVKLSLCLTKHHAMKAYWGVDV